MKNINWLLYPLLVVGVIVFSANIIFDSNRLDNLSENKKIVEEEQVKIAAMRRKLSVLASVDGPTLEGDLKYLNSAMPTTKMVWFLVSEMEIAASESSVRIEEYKAKVGKGLSEATDEAKLTNTSQAVVDEGMKFTVMLSVKQLSDLQTMLASLEKRLPLTKINQLQYESGKAIVEVEGAWEAAKKISTENNILPDYQTSVADAKLKLSDFVSFPEIDVNQVPMQPNNNPF